MSTRGYADCGRRMAHMPLVYHPIYASFAKNWKYKPVSGTADVRQFSLPRYPRWSSGNSTIA